MQSTPPLRFRPPRRPRAFGPLPPRPDPWFQLSLPIPSDIVRRVELGLDLAEAGRDADAWWGQVQDRMERFVQERLPTGARHVALELDEAALEVVARFRLGGEAADAR